MRCWRRCRYGLQGWLETFLFLISFFFSAEKPTGPNRFRAVLTQLVPGTHGPIPYPGSGNVLGHAGETIPSAGNRLANSEFHTRHKSPEPCAFLRRTCGREGETQWAAGARHPQTRRAAKTPGGPAGDVARPRPNPLAVYRAGEQKRFANLWRSDQNQ